MAALCHPRPTAAVRAHRAARRLAWGLFAVAGLAIGPVRGAVVAPTPERIITLAPHVTEIVHAAGAGDQIVATVTASDFPAQARKLPRVGDGIMLNQERIIVLRPTLLIAWRPSGAAAQLEPLVQRMGARMAYSEPRRLLDIPAEVRRIGAMAGTSETADAAARAMEARIRRLEHRYADAAQVTVFVEVGSLPLYTIGEDPLLNDAMRVCGARNIYGDSGIPAPRVPVESVLVQAPRLLVAPGRTEAQRREVEARWAALGLAAARHGRVHGADPDALFRPGPRFIDATEALCAAVDAVRGETAPG